jgi:hypothetical protein
LIPQDRQEESNASIAEQHFREMPNRITQSKSSKGPSEP